MYIINIVAMKFSHLVNTNFIKHLNVHVCLNTFIQPCYTGSQKNLVFKKNNYRSTWIPSLVVFLCQMVEERSLKGECSTKLLYNK